MGGTTRDGGYLLSYVCREFVHCKCSYVPQDSQLIITSIPSHSVMMQTQGRRAQELYDSTVLVQW